MAKIHCKWQKQSRSYLLLSVLSDDSLSVDVEDFVEVEDDSLSVLDELSSDLVLPLSLLSFVLLDSLVLDDAEDCDDDDWLFVLLPDDELLSSLLLLLVFSVLDIICPSG